MFNLIKSLFKKKEKIGLTLENLENWFNNRTKALYENYEKNIENVKSKINDEIEYARKNSDNLLNARLKNDKITVKEEQFMHGNLDFYIKKFNYFLDSINVPDNDILPFLEGMHDNVTEFGKSTHKSYTILGNFFSNETYNCATNIKKIDNLFKKLKEIVSDKNIILAKSLSKEIKYLKHKIKNKKDLSNEKIMLDDDYARLKKDNDNIVSLIQNKESSPQYKEYHKFKVDEYKINEQLSELEDEITHLFSGIEHPIKKHLRINPEDAILLNKYLDEPLKTLLTDTEFKVLSILSKMEANINDSKIELKAKKKEKTLSVISEISEDKLNYFTSECNRLKLEKNEIYNRLDNFTITSDIDSLKDKIKIKKSEIDALKLKIENVKKQVSNLDIKKAKSILKQGIDELFSLDIEID